MALRTGHSARHAAAASGGGAPSARTAHPIAKPKPARTVDMHAHFLPKSWPNYAKRYGGVDWPWLRHDGEKPTGTFGYNRDCGAMLMVDDDEFRPVTAACWDVEERLIDLDRMRIGRQIISQTPLLFQWQRDGPVGAQVARDFNDLALEMVRSPEAQGRLETLCQVPLQDIDLACQEVSRCKATGHVGVQIGNHFGPKDLDDDALIAFLQHCADEDFPVLIHPWEMSPIGPGNRTKDYMMGWTVGMPTETHLSITRMILGGAFDRLPESLRVCFAHGGGSFPALLGRLDNAWRERSVARGKAQRPPREYMGRFSVDSAVFDPLVLRLLVETFGSDKVMLGSDYPFPLGEQEIGSLAKTAPGLTLAQREQILFRNSENFWKLSPLADSVKDDLPSSKVTDKSSTTTKSDADEPWLNPDKGPYPASRHLLSPQYRWIASPPFMQLRGTSTTPSVQPNGHSRTEIGFDQPSARVVGNFVKGSTSTSLRSLPLWNPATGSYDGEVGMSSAAEMQEAIASAKAAVTPGSPWREMSLENRCDIVKKLANSLQEECESFARAESRDTGKPLALARTLDVPRSIANLNFFAGLAPHIGGEHRRSSGPMESTSHAVRKPVGVVGLVTPWNLPLYLLTWKLAPALVMGNSVVAKPSELTPSTASMLAALGARAGLPDGVFNVVHGLGHEAGEALVSHPDVGAVSFTGGTATGAKVAASAAPQFKKLSLELGGKNPAIVFDDCSFEETVRSLVRSSFLNSGQICLCSSRILVQKDGRSDFFDRFVQAFVEEVERLRVGPPEAEDTDLGPVISSDHRSKILQSIEQAQKEGGQVLTGGTSLPTRLQETGGYYVLPTVILGLGPDSTMFQQEVFGPVVTIHPFESEADAIELANNSRYGLSASVWTESAARMEVASKLDAGTVWVNTWLNRELHVPFGGVKESGVSREGGMHSLDFYSEASTICWKTGSRQPLPMPGGGWANRTQRRGYASSAASSKNAPEPLGAYVLAKRGGDLLFLSGIGPRIPESNEVPGGPIEDNNGLRNDYDAAAQSRQCFENVKSVLRGYNCSLEDLVDVQVFLTDMKRDFATFNAVWKEVMGDHKCCRTTVEVGQLPPGGRIAVELKVVAQIPE